MVNGNRNGPKLMVTLTAILEINLGIFSSEEQQNFGVRTSAIVLAHGYEISK